MKKTYTSFGFFNKTPVMILLTFVNILVKVLLKTVSIFNLLVCYVHKYTACIVNLVKNQLCSIQKSKCKQKHRAFFA